MEVDRTLTHASEDIEKSHRSIKKQKGMSSSAEHLSETRPQESTEGNLVMYEDPPVNAWGTKSFAEATTDEQHFSNDYYMGEDDEREFDEIEEWCAASEASENFGTGGFSVARISVEKYHSLFKPWRGAPVLKLLGKTVSFSVMQ